MSMLSAKHYGFISAGNTDDLALPAIPSNTTISIRCIDFTCPQGNDSAVLIYWNGTTLAKLQMAAQSDKFVSLAAPGISIDGDSVKQLTIRLENVNGTNAALLGCTIYYEQ